MKKAVIYARVSSKEQEKEGFSIPAQTRLLKEYALKHQLEVVKEFSEAETAKTSGRNKFDEMLKYLKKNKSVKIILVEKTDRLYRNFKDYVTLEDMDLEVHLIKEGGILSKNSKSHEKLMHGFKVLVAKNFIDNLKEETSKGMQEKAEQGIYPSVAPYGYLNITREDGKKIIAVNFEKAPFIKRMFELYATGAYSITTLREKIISEGFVYGKNGKAIPRSQVERILKNIFYTGSFEWRGKIYDNAQHDPIISKQLYYKVQEKLRDPRKAKTRVHDFGFTNMFKCGVCGCYLTAEIKKEQYIYYHCTGNKGKCGQKWVREELIMNTFQDLLLNLRLKEEEINEIKAGLKALHKQKVEYQNMSVEQIHQNLKRVQERIDSAYIDKLDGTITEDFWKAQTKKWQKEKDDLSIKMESFRKADKEYFQFSDLLLELCKNAYDLFFRQSAEEKRKLLNIVCSNFSYKDGELDIELNSPFNEIFLANQTKSAEIIQLKRDTDDAPISLSKKWLPGWDSNLQPFG